MKTLILSLIAFVLAVDAASAHAAFGIAGFSGGLLHPLLMPTHLMAVAALALLIGQQGWDRSVAVVYAGAVLTGLGAVALAYVPALAEEALLVCAAVAALLLAFGRPLAHWAGALIAGATGLALALNSPPEAIALQDANLALIGTALGAVAVLLILIPGATHLRRGWLRVGARILGSWIAASAVLVLALRLAS